MSPTRKTLGQHRIFQRTLAKVMYCPKRPTPDKKNVVLSKRQQKTIFWNLRGLLVTEGRKDWDTPAVLLVPPKKIGTVQHFCWFSCQNVVLSQNFVARDQKLWDSTALLLAILPKCCTVPLFLAELAKTLECPNLWGLQPAP